MLSRAQLRRFGRDGYLIVPNVIAESVLVELDGEVDALVERTPPPAGAVGFHHYFEHPSQLPVAVGTLYDAGVLEHAQALVAPRPLDLAFDHIQIATSLYGWDHRPGGGHIDGYGVAGQRAPLTFTLLAGVYLGDESAAGRGNLWVWPGSHLVHAQLFRERGVDVLMDEKAQGGHACLLDRAPPFGAGRPVLASRGDLVLAHYLLAHNQSGNMWNPMRRIVYFRLAADGHRARWEATQTDPFCEFAAVRAAR